ncbi:MAG: FHIPEP family type III secretion protein [Candidatus Eremiobacteraeota bacterium]|nr:FHIPEP family type III secretion protein [Candidatus Eremiobacteraeota bacterium]
MPPPCDAFEAVEKKNLKALERCISSGASVDAVNMRGSTLLHCAAFGGALPVSRFLLLRGAHGDAADREGMTPLHWASLKGHYELAVLLLEEGASVKASDRKGLTALHFAALGSHGRLVTLMADHYGRFAASEEEYRTFLSMKDLRGRTPLHLGAAFGAPGAVEALLKLAVDVNAQDNDYGATPLHYAAARGNTELIERLILAGADLSVKDSHGRKALHWALMAGHERVVRLFHLRGESESGVDRALMEIAGRRGTRAVLVNEYRDSNPRELMTAEAISAMLNCVPFDFFMESVRYMPPACGVRAILLAIAPPSLPCEHGGEYAGKFLSLAGYGEVPQGEAPEHLKSLFLSNPCRCAEIMGSLIASLKNFRETLWRNAFAALAGLVMRKWVAVAHKLVGKAPLPGSNDRSFHDGSVTVAPGTVPAGCTDMSRQNPWEKLFDVDMLTVEVGRELIHLLDPNQGAKLLERVKAIRKHLGLELGIVLPGVRFRDNFQLDPGGYVIKVRERTVACGRTEPRRLLAVGPRDKLSLLGCLHVEDPVFGLPGIWVDAGRRNECEKLGLMLFDDLCVVAAHLTEVASVRAAELLTLEDVAGMLEIVRKKHKVLVEEAMKRISPRGLHLLLQRLLEERMSIRDLKPVLETIVDVGSTDHELVVLEYRRANRHSILGRFANSRDEIAVIELAPELEEALRKSPVKGALIVRELGNAIDHCHGLGLHPLLLVSDDLRGGLFHALRERVKKVALISRSECVAPFTPVTLYLLRGTDEITGAVVEAGMSQYYLGRDEEASAREAPTVSQMLRPPLERLAIVLLSLPPNLASQVLGACSAPLTEKISSAIARFSRIHDEERFDCIMEFLGEFGVKHCVREECLMVLDRIVGPDPAACGRIIETLAGEKKE